MEDKNNSSKKDKRDILYVGHSFDFWLEEEENIYDEVYGNGNKREQEDAETRGDIHN